MEKRLEHAVVIPQGEAKQRLHAHAEPVRRVEGAYSEELDGVVGHFEEQREAEYEGGLLVSRLDGEEGQGAAGEEVGWFGG